MMKLRVCDEFTDKNTGALYRIGEIIEVDDKRGAEIMAAPQKLAEVVEGPQPQKSVSEEKPKPKRKRSVKK